MISRSLGLLVTPFGDEIRCTECKHGCVRPLVVRLYPSAEPLQVARGNHAYCAFRVGDVYMSTRKC